MLEEKLYIYAKSRPINILKLHILIHFKRFKNSPLLKLDINIFKPSPDFVDSLLKALIAETFAANALGTAPCHLYSVSAVLSVSSGCSIRVHHCDTEPQPGALP